MEKILSSALKAARGESFVNVPVDYKPIGYASLAELGMYLIDALRSEYPWEFFRVLDEGGVLNEVYPEVWKLKENDSFNDVMCTIESVNDSFSRFMILFQHLDRVELFSLCRRLARPDTFAKRTILYKLLKPRLHQVPRMRMSKKYDYVSKMSERFKNMERFQCLLEALFAEYRGNAFIQEEIYHAICDIFYEMYKIKDKDLPEWEILQRHRGSKRRELTRRFRIEYLRRKLNGES